MERDLSLLFAAQADTVGDFGQAGSVELENGGVLRHLGLIGEPTAGADEVHIADFCWMEQPEEAAVIVKPLQVPAPLRRCVDDV